MSRDAPARHTPSRAEIVDLLAGLVRIPSVNPSLNPEEGRPEGEIAAFARDWLESRGVTAWLDEIEPGRANAVARVGSETGPTLVLCGHLDTVGSQGMADPFAPRMDGGRLYGRGAYDMKAGVAAAMAAAAALVREPLPGSVQLALVADEEFQSRGADDFVRRYRADGCIVTEPTEERLILAHKGFVWAEIETAGVAAHGSRWDLGVSAIGRMGRIVAALEEFDRRELRARAHPLLDAPSLHCAQIEGGVGLSTYAPSCRLRVERRTLPGETPEQVVEELRRVVAASGEEAEVRRIFSRPPSTCEPDALLARCVREAAAQVSGQTPADGGVAYWMDAAVFTAAGIPTVTLGPAGDGAHAAEEWVDIDSAVRCARSLAEASRRFLRAAGDGSG